MNVSLRLTVFFCFAIVVSSTGAQSTAPSDVPVGPPTDFLMLSAGDRLGIKYNPVTKVDDSAFVVPRLPGTILLPRFIVDDSRVKLTERDVLTEKATLEIAENKYLSPLYRVTFGPLMQIAEYYFSPLSIVKGWHPNEAEAMTLYRQDKRLEKLAELDSLIGLELIDDAKDAKEFQKLQFDASVSSR
jgi:hypothetical protein